MVCTSGSILLMCNGWINTHKAAPIMSCLRNHLLSMCSNAVHISSYIKP